MHTTTMSRSPSRKLDYVRVVRKMLERINGNQDDLARRLGVTQPSISRWINGSEPKMKHHNRIMEEARELGVINHPEEIASQTVPVVGYVKAGGEAHLYEEGQGPFGEAPMPPGDDGHLKVAVIVKGDSMSPVADDGWLIYYDTRQDPPTDDLFGKLCVIGLDDGRVVFKRLYQGSRTGLFTLISVNGAPIHDVRVVWAARVAWIAPR